MRPVKPDSAAEREKIVDHLYGVALDPSELVALIDFWHETDLAAQISMLNRAEESGFDHSYRVHLDRANAILQGSGQPRPKISEFLRPYESLAACIVNPSLRVEASNPGALTAFGIYQGDALDQMRLSDEMRAALIQATREVLAGIDHPEKLLKAEYSEKRGALLFRIRRIDHALQNGPAVLIVSTQFHWRDSLGDLLGTAFHLTRAERDVVRALVEGQDAKLIAETRGTSDGTVRGQIKSILGKMNLRSQTDIVRLAMTLGALPEGRPNEPSPDLVEPRIAENWLQDEVWKPFKTLTLPDGRALTYHDMGPARGHPVLFSHMGSCMVRWSRSMIRMAFEQNLRVICPIRAGYGQSDALPHAADAIVTAREDTLALLSHLGIERLPYVVQGTDFPFVTDLINARPGVVSEVIGVGARPCLPDGTQPDGAGRWQRFFVSTARSAPHLVKFASRAVMAMSQRIGPTAMLRQLCKDSPADLALLEQEEMREVLEANLELMAGASTNAALSFALEFIAFQDDWSDRVKATSPVPMQLFLAEEDPTIDLNALQALIDAYPWMRFQTVSDAGLAQMFQKAETLIPLIAEAARR